MIKIAAHIPNPHDATAYYRAMTPFAHLRKCMQGGAHGEDFDITVLREWSGPTAMQYDVAFFQRPCSPAELEAIRICKRLGVPVIVDYDDLLFDLPTDNPSYSMYMNRQTQETIVSIIREADCVWVSTSELKRCFQVPNSSLNEKIYVVPNALDDVHLVRGPRHLPPPPSKRQAAVLWRGSATHERDVMDYTPEIFEVADENEKLTFIFVGYNPWFLTNRMRQKQAVCTGGMPVGEFMEFLYATAARVGIVPLHESRFNRCKSNIAWLEMTWSGTVVLGPDWEEWRHPGITTYRTPVEFKAKLTELVTSSKEKIQELHKESWNHIQKHFTLTAVNPIRANTILALLGRVKWPDGWQPLPELAEESVMELE